MFIDFINYYPAIKPETITKEQVMGYVIYLVKERNVSVSYQNQAINAINSSTTDFSLRKY